MMDAKWYSVNFANEQILQGQHTQFLRFKNKWSQPIFIYVIPELLNVDPNDTSYRGIVALNGADIFDINATFKNTNNLDYVLDSGVLSEPFNVRGNDKVFSVFGSYPNPTSTGNGGLVDHLRLRFPANNLINIGPFNLPGYFSSSLPVQAKNNYRIDYKGEKDVVVKLSFLITTIDPQTNNWDNFPALNPTSNEMPGDVRDNGGVWEYLDNSLTPTWQVFDSPYDIEGPWKGIKNLHQKGLFNNTVDWTGDLIDVQEVYLFCYPENSSKPSRETDYWLDKDISAVNVYDTQDSFMLLRTNPKISGNIKLVVDSKSSMYLESIDANADLSNSKFKKNKISPSGSYPVDLKKYFSSLSPEVLYEVGQNDNQYLNTKRNFSEQYDFFYGYGVSQLKSKFYDEEFSIFAPIWLRKKLPDFFVIFKTIGPLNKETYNLNNKETILNELLSDSKILKTFDMREGSTIGSYLRNIVNDKRFVEQPLSVNYEKDELTTWSGVSYREGILSSKGEFLYDFFNTDKPINEFEEFITKGFERNGLICTNLINFEFLFDDVESQEYEINRYFGLYVYENELAKFELFGDGFSKLTEQSPLPRKNVDGEPYSMQPFIQNNDNGILVPVDYFHGNGPVGQPEYVGNVIGKLPLNVSVQDPLRVFYIRDREDNIDRIKSVEEFVYGLPNDPDFMRFTGIRLYDNELDLSKYAGLSKLESQVEANLLDVGYSQLSIELYDVLNDDYVFTEGEILEIEWVDINQERQKWQMIANSTGLQIGDFWNFPLYNPDEFLYVNTFNPNGSPSDVAKALVGCINHFNNRIFDAIQVENKIILKFKLSGEAGNGLLFRRNLVRTSSINNIKFYDIPVDFNFNYITTTDIDVLTTGNFTFSELVNDGRVNEYSIKITNVGVNTITTEIRKNGGWIVNYSWDFSLPTIIPFNNGEIEIIPENGIFNVDDIWHFILNDPIIDQRFLGGTSRKRNRASVKTTDIPDMKSEYWYQSQKSKYSRLREWDVQGSKLFYIYDLEESVIEDGILTNYKNLFDRSIIQLEDTNFEFYISKEKRILGYDAFEPTIGIMSFLHVKDFDFDWLRSDYSYVPNAETFHYYEMFDLANINDEIELDLYTDYIVENGILEIYGYDQVSDTWISTGYTFDSITNSHFNTYLPTYEYDISSTGTIDSILPFSNDEFNYLYKNYKAIQSISAYTKLKAVALSVNTSVRKSSYIADSDLIKFNGFLGISDFFSVEDEAELSLLIANNDIDRFFFEQLSSEYDRLRENFVKEYAVKSKVVPYINKWVQTGTDCRDNQYRLNNSLAFGLTGFAPDTEIKEQNSQLHTHEFYYLDKFPVGYPSEFFQNSRSYFYQDITSKSVNVDGIDKSWYELFKDNSKDWFSKYFSLGYPSELNVEGEKVKKKTEERFIFTSFIEGVEEVQGVFRGGKFSIKEIDPITGNVISNSKKYDHYKFSSILRILPPSIDSNEQPSEIEFIANDVHKTIVMIITLYVKDYKIQSGGYGYLFLYAGSSLFRSSDVYTKYVGDVTPSLMHPLGVDYTDVTTFKHYNGLNGSLLLDYADIKLSGVFDFSTGASPFVPSRTYSSVNNSGLNFSPIEEIQPIIGDNYDKELKFNPVIESQIGNYNLEVFERGGYSEISQFYSNSPQRLISNHQSGENVPMVTTQFTINFSGSLSYPHTYTTQGVTNSFVGWPTKQNVIIPLNTVDEDTNTWYLSGGFEYLKKRLEDISFSSIFTRVNNNSLVNYWTVNNQGVSNGNYIFRFIDFDRIDKSNRLYVDEDIDKPEVYLEKELIGFDILNSSDSESLFRHRGRFEPKTRKVFNYWVREDENMTNHYGLDFLLSNTRFGVEYPYFGEIENLYFSKVSPNEIMKISSTSKYKSQYPLIDEIAIDHKNFDVYLSNWDNNYYNLYNGLKENTTQEGTLELKENKSFFGSKVMNVPNKFDIHTFLSDEISWNITEGLQSTDVSALKSANQSAVLNSSTKNKLTVNIDASKRLLRQMLEENAKYEFEKLKNAGITRFATISDEELSLIVRQYLEINILPLYKVGEIKLYVKDPADSTVDDIFRIDLTETQKLQNGYRPLKNTKVDQISQFEYVITELLDTKKYKAYSVSITLERI